MAPSRHRFLHQRPLEEMPVAIHLHRPPDDQLHPLVCPHSRRSLHLADLASRAGREGRAPRLWAPLLTLDKLSIVREARRLEVPIAETWSCYAGGAEPCGVCDSCRIRNRALLEAYWNPAAGQAT